jgi:hypothetical protein
VYCGLAKERFQFPCRWSMFPGGHAAHRKAKVTISECKAVAVILFWFQIIDA